VNNIAAKFITRTSMQTIIHNLCKVAIGLHGVGLWTHVLIGNGLGDGPQCTCLDCQWGEE
jgi:hypothetical protein